MIVSIDYIMLYETHTGLNHYFKLHSWKVPASGGTSSPDHHLQKFSPQQNHKLSHFNYFSFASQSSETLLNQLIYTYLYTHQKSNLRIEYTRTTGRQNTVRMLDPRLWNILPTEVKSAPVLAVFKRRLKKQDWILQAKQDISTDIWIILTSIKYPN